MGKKLTPEEKKHISSDLNYIENQSRKSIKIGYDIKKTVLVILILITSYNAIGSLISKDHGIGILFTFGTIILFAFYLEALKNEIIEKIQKNI